MSLPLTPNEIQNLFGTLNRTLKKHHQNSVVQAMIDRYNHGSGVAYVITHWPDEEERRSRACDAYAEAKGARPLAIEHTLIQSYNQQKQHDAEFMRVIGDLEAELRSAFSFPLKLLIPMFAVQKGQRWDQIKNALKTWLLTNLIAPGRTQPAIPGVPFPVTLLREDHGKVGLTVGRTSDGSLDVAAGLIGNIEAALASKNDQLRAYRKAGDCTILVLESDDVVFANPVDVYRAFLTAEKAVDISDVDQVWLALNTIDVYCMKAPQEFIDAVNPSNVMFGPRYHNLWMERVV